MNNPFPYSDSNKRYLTQSCYFKKRFGQKVMKISLNAGFTCPNIDGSKGVGGCSYCLDGSGEFGGNPDESITRQFYSVKAKMNEKWSEGLYIAYFQAHTNTYAPVEKIRAMCEEALSLDSIAGISLSTRPDCISDDALDYLEELSHRTYLTVELGLQTVHDKTALRINRCHSYSDFLRCFERLDRRGINVTVHLINGLPDEDFEMMLRSAEEMARLPLHGIKLHLLHILKGTRLETEYMRGQVIPMTLEEYVQIICAQLEVLPPQLVIGRLTGDGGRDVLTAPLWSLKKFTVLNEIDKQLLKNNTYQGRLYRGR